MLLQTEQLTGGITLVHLAGRMDTEGAVAVDLKMMAIAGAHRAVVIDLTQLNYLASMGIRTLTLSAKTIADRGGRVACFGANENVTRVLETSGVASVVPMFGDIERATASVAS